MASDTTKITLRDQYFSLPSGNVKQSISNDFFRLFGETPEQSLLRDQALTLRSANAISGVSFIDPTQFNPGTGVFDQTARFAGIGGTGTTPGQTGGGTPVGPTVTTPSTSQRGGFTNPTVAVGPTTTTITRPDGPITVVDPGTGRRTTGPVNTGDVGTTVNDLVRDGRSIDFIVGSDPERILSPCRNPTYRLGKLTELKVQGDFDPNPDFAFLNSKKCVLIAEVFKCCPDLGEAFIGYVELGRSKSSKFYEDCPDGGKRPVVEEYYEVTELGPTTFVLNKLDNLGLNTVTDSSTQASVELLKLRTAIWSDTACRVQTLNDPLAPPVTSFSTFDEYFNSKYQNGITIGSESRQILRGNAIRSAVNVSSPNQVIGNFIESVKASCGASGNCIKKDTPPPQQNCVGTEEVERSRRLIESGILEAANVPVQTIPQPVPGQPCKLGIPMEMEIFDVYEVQYGFPVYGNPNCIGEPVAYQPARTATERISRGRRTEYTQITIDPKCEYTEVEKEYEEDDPTDKCFGIIKKDVTRVYQDGRTELYLKGAFVRYYRKQDADCSPETIKVYHPLDLGKDIMNAKIRAKTKGLFDGAQTLECHHTSSTQPTASKTHYYEVTDCDSCGKTPYFAVSYGHNQGSGSIWAEGELNDTPTRAIYSQYRLLALDLPDTSFTFYTNGVATSSKDVYVINFSRTGMSDRVDPGNWEIPLAELRGGSYANSVFTGSNVAVSSSNKVFTFIDDSDDRSDTISCTHDPYVSYDVVSGSLTDGVYSTNSKHTYGIMYPNLGIIVLDPYKLNTELGFNTVSGSNIAGDNSFKLFTSISGSGTLGKYIKARNVKYKTTNHYFVRVAAPLANYSNNPTYVSGSNGEFFHPCFDLNPQTYITSVGLYNDFNELLAVAKLSRPINKSFDNDVLIKIRLNW